MAELYIAMHAPKGRCIVDLHTSSGRVYFSDFRLVGGNPSKWNRLECGRHRIYAENNDASQHLHLKCIVHEGIFGDGGGQVVERVEPTGDNNASMWCTVNGGPQIGVHTNPSTGKPAEATVYTWFSLAGEAVPTLGPEFLTEDAVTE